jgi:Raf kinase inhibitor-like YbhB/YbcL family protein
VRTGIAALLAAFLLGCGGGTGEGQRPPADTGEPTQADAETAEADEEGSEMSLTITSPFFKEGDMIPALFTCDGEDHSPALSWTAVPPGTASFALICDDPDAPSGDWVHWVIYDLPAGVAGLPEKVPGADRLEGGGVHGKNSWGRLGYGGPCPPGGIHRYFFKLYALDVTLGLDPGATKADVLKAMKGHVLAEAQLMGRYKRR